MKCDVHGVEDCQSKSCMIWADNKAMTLALLDRLEKITTERDRYREALGKIANGLSDDGTTDGERRIPFSEEGLRRIAQEAREGK